LFDFEGYRMPNRDALMYWQERCERLIIPVLGSLELTRIKMRAAIQRCQYLRSQIIMNRHHYAATHKNGNGYHLNGK
jgi:uncharacterized protein YqgQ